VRKFKGRTFNVALSYEDVPRNF